MRISYSSKGSGNLVMSRSLIVIWVEAISSKGLPALKKESVTSGNNYSNSKLEFVDL